VSQKYALTGTESVVTDHQGIAQVEWRPLTSDDSYDSIGSVTVELRDGTSEERGQMTRADTARFAIQIFGGSPTRIAVGGGFVKWTERP
jgi:hypothetical protein